MYKLRIVALAIRLRKFNETLGNLLSIRPLIIRELPIICCKFMTNNEGGRNGVYISK